MLVTREGGRERREGDRKRGREGEREEGMKRRERAKERRIWKQGIK